MTKQLHVTFTADVTAADAEKGVIVGKVVPYGTFGNTSLGPVAFQAGAFGKVPETVKLLLEHDARRPIGRATSFVDGPDHMSGTFKLSRTTAGRDALIEAAEGLREGLSVGANIIDFEDTENGYVVTAAELVEVSLVTTPAFPQAGVEQVAASEPQPDAPSEPSEEDDTMNPETTEVEAAAEVVEASHTVEAAAPTRQYVTVEHRDVRNMTAGLFAKRQLEAQAGDREAQLVVQAALADNTTTTGAGLVPTRFLTEVISVIDASRPVVESITRDVLPDAGDEFKIPRVTQKPSVAEQAAEGDEVSSTAFNLDYLTVPVKTFAGGERISRQLIERSDPAFLDRLLIEMGAQYAQKTDAYAWSVLNAGKAESNGTTIYGTIADAIADSWSVMRFAPNRILVTPNGTGDVTYAKLLAAVDEDKRPLFASANPSNAAGLITQGTTQGTVAGLQVVVDANIGDVEAFVYPAAAATFYEAGGAPINVSVQDVSTLEVEVAVYGYVACAAKYPTAVRWLNVA
jgi:HK97 family phage prohead protease/HK97 family phage major capsid protein